MRLAALVVLCAVAMGARPDVIAHRGFSGTAPENTLIAVKWGLDVPTANIEIDLQVTSDDYVVLMHDTTIDRTTNGKGSVRSHPLPYLKTLDAGSWKGPQFAGERVPTLEELFTMMEEQAGGRYVVLDCKTIDYNLLSLIADSLRFHPTMREQIRLGCWDQNCLRETQRLLPGVKSLLIASFPPATSSFNTYRSLGCTAFNLNRIGITASFVNSAHSAGFLVKAWTLNTESQIRDAVRLGVDGITGDYPDLTQRVVDGSKKMANSTFEDERAEAELTDALVRGCLDYHFIGVAMPEHPSPAEQYFASSAACKTISACPIEPDHARVLIEDSSTGVRCRSAVQKLREKFTLE